MSGRRVGIIGLLVATVGVTIFTFWWFDHTSHSASDTLRPFIITMAPVWVLVGWAIRRLTRAR